MHQIFIPSKGRAKTAKFLQLLREANLYCCIVVEQEDEAAYKQEYPECSFLVLPESNKGISYVRNFIKKYCEDHSIYFHWMIDDDLTSLYKREGTKMIKEAIFATLQNAERQFMNYSSFGIAALDYQQIAWSASKPIIEDGYAEVCVLTNNTTTFGMRYRPEAEGKEDRDFAMQCVRDGAGTLRSTLFAFAAPANGTNAGGLKEIFYSLAGREEQCVDAMVNIWGSDICYKNLKPNGRIDLKILWNKIKAPKTTNLFEL